MSRVLARPNHRLISIMTSIQNFAECPTNVIKLPLPFLYKCFTICSQFSHLINTSKIPTYCNFPFSIMFTSSQILLNEGVIIRNNPNPLACFNCLFPLTPDKVRFFMDGSKTENRPFAVVDISGNCTHFRTSCEAFIFFCEAMVILMALKFGSNSSDRISIFADSQSVLCALLPSKKSRKNSPNLILSICDTVEDLNCRRKDVTLIWIPPHLNFAGNEQADYAVKEAIISRVDSELLLPPLDLITSWRNKLYCSLFEWVENWGLTKNSYFFEHFSVRNRKPWFSNFKFKRKSVESLNRLRSGYTTLAKCLFKHNVLDTSLCEYGVVQSPIHMFWQCKLLDVQRKKTFFFLFILIILWARSASNSSYILWIRTSFSHWLFSLMPFWSEYSAPPCASK